MPIHGVQYTDLTNAWVKEEKHLSETLNACYHIAQIRDMCFESKQILNRQVTFTCIITEN